MNESQKPTPRSCLSSIERQRLIDALSEIVQESSLGTWMQQSNDALDGLKPMEVIDLGQSDRLWEMIFNLRSGNPS